MRHKGDNGFMARIREYSVKGGRTKWRVAWRPVGGGHVERSMSFGTESEAKQWKALIESSHNDDQKAARILRAAKQKGPTVEDMIDQFIDEASQGTDETRRKYRSNARIYIFDEIGWVPVKDLTSRDVRRLVRSITDKGKSAKTVKNVIGVLSGAMRIAVQDGLINGSPTEGVTLPKIQKRLPPNLSTATVDGVIAGIDPHFSPLVEFLAYAGVRWSEAEALQVRDVSSAPSARRSTTARTMQPTSSSTSC